ncbi:MAG TPA: hypothetical protein VIL78_07975 [Hanamia sp.]
MPSQIDVQITGRIQNVIFYKRGDKYYARSVPLKVKQTKATKKRATEFGKASRLGKCLREQLLPAIPFPSDNKMQTRLVSALFQWLRSGYDATQSNDDVPFVSNFSFTEGYSVRERWKVALQITKPEDGLIELKIPAFVAVKSVSAPSGTVSVTCIIGVAGCDVDNGISTGGFSTFILYEYNEEEVPERIVSLPVPTPSGSLIVTAISLEYNFIKNGHLQKTGNKAFMPASVVSAMYF